MPACITHNQFAQDVLTQLSSPAADLCAFFWGAQGPDFLFCHRYIQVSARKGQRSLQEYGSALHKTPPSQTLSAMRNSLAHHSNPTYRSYILGFICHYALDSTAHPYINARAVQLAAQRPNENTSTMHGEIESALDAIVLRWKTGALPSQVRLKDLFPKNEGVQRQIACLYRELLFAVYRQDVPEQSLYQATNDAHFLFACSTDRTGLKRSFFNRLEQGRPHYVTSHLVPITEDPEMDYANTQHEKWRWKDLASCQDFFQLYEHALALALELGNHFDTVDFKGATGDRPFG